MREGPREELPLKTDESVGKNRRRRTALLYRFDRWVAEGRLVPWMEGPKMQAFLRITDHLPKYRRPIDPHLGPRSIEIPELPEEWKGEPGIPRDRALEEDAYKKRGPLPTFLKLHHEAEDFYQRHSWRLFWTVRRQDKKTLARLAALPTKKEGVQRPDYDSQTLSKIVRDKAAELGISAIGVTVPDPMANYSGQEIQPHETRVIVCILEQNWEATQTIPSLQGDKAHYECTMQLREIMAQFVEFIHELGYSARMDAPRIGMVIAYGVAAGLGQLGLNGQLLTPFSGSRNRINLLVTDAPLELDEPVDYGVKALCDTCQVCVQNCPTGAIRSKREFHRGIYKAAIKPERCFPVVSMVHGCGICQKVCPVQRYGLPAVIEEFKETGKVLGKGTDELEGYRWPVDGKHYGPNERPSAIAQKVLVHPTFFIDLERKVDEDYEDSPYGHD
jgi:ferredoxin